MKKEREVTYLLFIMVIVALLILLISVSSCVSTSYYRAYNRGLNDKYDQEQADAKANGKHINPMWHNRNGYPH